MMRLLIWSFLCLSLGATAQSVNWISFSELESAVKKDPKPVIVDMYTTWCGPCKMMDKNTFNNPEVAAYINKHFHAVKFNAEGDERIVFRGQTFQNEQYDPGKRGRNATHPFAGNFAVKGRLAYPTTAYMDSDLNLLTQPVQGYLTPDRIEPILKYFGTGAYKDTDWETFNASMKQEW